MELIVFPVGPLAANCAILWLETTGEAFVFDPGDDAPKIIEELEQRKLNPTHLLCTHAHFDHINALGALKQHYPQAKVCLHKGDEELYNHTLRQALAFGMRASSPPPVDFWLEDGTVLLLGTHEVKVLHTPGHSPGSVSFAFQMDNQWHIVCGDTVFAMGVGRTDLWGGDWNTLMRSIKDVLFAYPDDTVLIPGHGPATTVGRERSMNPWLTGEFSPEDYDEDE